MKYNLVLILLLFHYIALTQNEANIWYFGENAGLDFNSGSPVALLDGSLVTNEGCASIADSSGSLLFYTDGTTVYNRNHNVMVNGNDLNGHPSSTQSAIIVPKPNSSNIYFIFTVDYQGQPNGLQYSEVDMTLNGGLGGVTSNKNILLLTPVMEKLTAVQHQNGTDIWVVAHKNGSAEFYSYLVNDLGVQTPVISDIGNDFGGFGYDVNAGYMKCSPDGSKLATVYPRYLNSLQVFDFDNATGALSNLQNIFYEGASVGTPYGVEFSLSGELVYVTGSGGIYQYDLTQPSAFDILFNAVLLHNEIENSSWRALQMATDGKIYVTRSANEDTPEIHTLSVINNPEELGSSCDFQLDAISLGSGIARSGLPPFIQSYFNVSIQTDNVCFGETTTFSAVLPDVYDSLEWDFGDGNFSNLENPMHTYVASGDYNVTLTVTVGGESSSDSKVVTIYEQPTANAIAGQIFCDNDHDGFEAIDLTTFDSDILNGQDASVFNIVYYDGMTNYNNGVSINTSEIDVSTSTNIDIIASIRNINNSECEDMTVFNISVLESPNPSSTISDIPICDNNSFGTDSDGIVLFDLTVNEMAILNGQSSADFTVNYFNDTALINQIVDPSTYQNTNVFETIYVQVVNNLDNRCNAEVQFNIEVLESPIINSVVSISQCDDDLDGFSSFNLLEVIDEITSNSASETITFYESQLDAESETSPITSPTSYVNQTVSTDVIWARIENSNGCYKTSQINLTVSTTQIPSAFMRDFYKCDDLMDGDNTNGISLFDFTSVNAEIESLFPSGQELIINYYRNQDDALAESNPIVDIGNYRNIGYPYSQDIYVRVDSELDNDCLGLGHHITLHVETIPIAYEVAIDQQCDADGDGMYEFDTSNIEDELLAGQVNIDVTYLDENGNTLSSPLPNPFITGSQTVTVILTNSNSLDPDGACYTETSIDFNVDDAVVAYPIGDLNGCDDNQDGTFAFDTTTIQSQILNGQTNVIVTYLDENGMTLPTPLPNPFVSETQSVIVSVENVLNPSCNDQTTINFIVNTEPQANDVQDDFVCDDDSNDGEYMFTLNEYDSQVLGSQSNSIFEVLYFNNLTNAQNNTGALPNNYLLDISREIIYARIQNRDNNSCYDITSFEIGISSMPTAYQPQNISVCDDESNDGVEEFNLANHDQDILNGQSETDYSITYHVTYSDAENDLNPLPAIYSNTQAQQTIYARLENNNNQNCYSVTQFDLIVNYTPVLSMDDIWSICENDTIEIFADTGYDEYLWSTGETAPSIIVNTSGNYEVIATNIYGDLRCETSKTITVLESGIASITEIEVEDWSANNNQIVVLVEGTGDYEFSLDGINYQDSNVFSYLNVDDYTVFVRDKNGCGIATEEVYILYYPKVFTPNNDGTNDTWQLYNSNKEPNNIIYIFDRYGKLLKQLSPNSIGWDGSFNGNVMPNSDYWFVLKRHNGKQYNGHFTLKR